MKKFEAEILEGGKGGAFVVLPFDVEKEYGKKRLKVKVTFDGVPYRGSVMKYGTPQHILLIRKDIRERINKQPGDTVSVTFEEDTEPRVVILPDDLESLLAAHPSAKTFFDKLSYTHQREYVEWVTGAKRADTRERRMAKMLEMLSQGKRGR